MQVDFIVKSFHELPNKISAIYINNCGSCSYFIEDNNDNKGDNKDNDVGWYYSQIKDNDVGWYYSQIF